MSRGVLRESKRDNANLTVPSSWHKPTVTQTPDEMLDIAARGLTKLLRGLNQTTGLMDSYPFPSSTTAEIYNQMLLYDLFTNGNQYRDQVVNGLKTVAKAFPQFNNPYLNLALEMGVTAVRASQQYGDSELLSLAQDNWAYGAAYTLTQAQLNAGSTPKKNFPLQGSCQQASMAGGTFWFNDPTNPLLNTIATGSMLTLSALLAEATSNKTYLDLATLCGNFMHSHLYSTSGIVQGGISARQNDSCSTNSVSFPYNLGYFLEGTAILANITNSSPLQLLVESTIAASLGSQPWQNKNGIVKGGQPEPFLIRGMAESYMRNPANFQLRGLIRAFLSVQYNAILDFATNPGSDIYTGSWSGPPESGFDGTNQSTATSVLVRMVAINNGAQPTAPTKSSLTTSAIIGGVVGGFALLVLVGILVWFLRRRKSARRKQMFVIDGPDSPTPTDPFTDRAPDKRPTIEPFIIEQFDLHSGPSPSREKGSTRRAGENYSTVNQHIPPSVSSGGGGGGPSSSGRGATEIPTEELVHVLNARLQANASTWDTGEAPPKYQNPNVGSVLSIHRSPTSDSQMHTGFSPSRS